MDNVARQPVLGIRVSAGEARGELDGRHGVRLDGLEVAKEGEPRQVGRRVGHRVRGRGGRLGSGVVLGGRDERDVGRKPGEEGNSLGRRIRRNPVHRQGNIGSGSDVSESGCDLNLEDGRVAFVLAVRDVIHHANGHASESLGEGLGLEAVVAGEDGRERRKLGQGEDATSHDDRLVDRRDSVRGADVDMVVVGEPLRRVEGIRRDSEAGDGVRKLHGRGSGRMCFERNDADISMRYGQKGTALFVQRLVTWKRRRKPERRSEGGSKELMATGCGWRLTPKHLEERSSSLANKAGTRRRRPR